jgi:cyclic pyranopterin phosphate synthase
MLQSFETYNKMGAKFRVAVVNKCNMNCFFCHNEGMENPRSPGDKVPLQKVGKETMAIENVIQLMNDFCELGGTQLNITGGEPLARKDICDVLRAINKRNTRVVLNSNVLLADRLLKEPKIDTVDAIYASLHTTKEQDFKDHLGIGGGASRVMQNMVLLAKHGYRVQINYSLGDFNKDQFGPVMDFALENDIDLKAITLIRSDENKNQYGESMANTIVVRASAKE